MRGYSKLLIHEEPLQVLPSLAAQIGLNEAIVLQQIHYWMNPKRHSGKVVDGRRWIFNSYAQWQEQFPFWTEKQIGNAVRKLEGDGLLSSRQDLNAIGSDRRKWYSVNYEHEALALVDDFWEVDSPSEDSHRPILDIQHTESGRSSITETTAETTSEILSPSKFDAAWEAYPRKQGKGGAKKAWDKIKPNDDLFEKIMDAIARQKQSHNWKKERGQFIPYFSKWLNEERWDDEVDTSGTPERKRSSVPGLI